MTENKSKIRSRVILFLVLALTAGFTVWVNREISIRGLYMDDLYMWSCYGEQSFLEFVLPIGTSTRFRPVYWLAAWLQMLIIGNHVDRFVGFNIVMNILVCWETTLFAKRVSKSSLMGLCAGLCYSASRFAYYQIGQALGLMETMATGMALGVLWILYEALRGEKNGNLNRKMTAAVILWFLLVFVHERYCSLILLFYYVLIVRLMRTQRGQRGTAFRKSLTSWLLPAAAVLVILLIRALTLGKTLPAGTGGTEVTDTFRGRDAVAYAGSQLWYLLGVNAGPEYLSGVHWENVPVLLKAVVKLGVLALAVIGIMYLIALCMEWKGGPEGRSRFKSHLTEALLFALFILFCIGASSVTIRVEMRWIYVSYAAMVILLSGMVRTVTEEYRIVCEEEDADHLEEGNILQHSAGKTIGKFFSPRVVTVLMVLVFLFYTAVSVCSNIGYRRYFPNIYFWENQTRMNSLADETIGKYGRDGIFGRPVYIIGNSYEMTDFYAETFFKPYDREKTAGGTRIYFVEDVSEIPDRDYENCILLRESPETRGYEDLTEHKPKR